MCIRDSSGDKTQGGHILGLSADHLTLKINQIERFDLTLPRNPEFAQRDLCEMCIRDSLSPSYQSVKPSSV